MVKSTLIIVFLLLFATVLYARQIPEAKAEPKANEDELIKVSNRVKRGRFWPIGFKIPPYRPRNDDRGESPPARPPRPPPPPPVPRQWSFSQRAWAAPEPLGNRQVIAPGNGPIELAVVNPGLRNRVDGVYANIGFEHLNQGSVTNVGQRQRVREMGALPNDQAGHLIGRQLGGSGTADHNIMPQNGRINMGLWRAREDEIARAIRENPNNRVHMYVRPLYNGDSMRPGGHWFRATMVDQNGGFVREWPAQFVPNPGNGPSVWRSDFTG